MRRVVRKPTAAAISLALAASGTLFALPVTEAQQATPLSLGAPFQAGQSFTVTWGGSTDIGSGLASYSISVRRAPFNGGFGPWEPFKADVLPTPPDAVIAAAGDIACGKASTGTAPETCKEMQTSDLMLQMNPAAVLPLGDVQYEKGELDDFHGGRPGWVNTGYHSTWGRLKAVTRPAVGNHEYTDPAGGAKGYFDYFNGLGNFTGPAGDRTKGYYSFDIGSWHLVALNSNCTYTDPPLCGKGSVQEQWLRADLAAHPRSCTLAYVHHPRWSSHYDTAYLQPMFQALYDHGVELLLAGHSHFYERFAPQDPSQNLDLIRGVRQIVVGTGGRSVSPPDPSGLDPYSEVRDGNTFGVLKLTLRPKSYDWQFLPIAGQTFTDSGSTACHGLVADTTPPTVPTVGGPGATGSGSATFIGEPGSTYCFQATAADREGNNSQPSGEYCTAIPLDNVSFKHRGGWLKKLGTGHYLETFSQTKLLGATMTLSNVTAKHLAIIVTKCPKCGVVKVFFGGQLLRRIQLRSSTTKKFRTIELKTFDSVLTGTLKVRVISDGKLVKVDGLGISAV